MDNSVISFQDYKRNKENKKTTNKSSYFVDFIDNKRYLIVVEATNKWEAEALVKKMCEADNLTSKLTPDQSWLKIIKIQKEDNNGD